VLSRLLHGSTKPITDERGRRLPASIAALEQVALGGVAQSLLIRGHDVHNPVLLYLHGGPGTSELGMLRSHNLPALERRFTVAVWDQRGAAKSFAARRPASAMSVEQLVDDATELSAWLCQRFETPNLYLVGHSWGSALGALAVHRRPELYRAYVGVGQIANMLEGERLSYAWTVDQAERAGDRRSLARLRAIGEPPYAPPMRPKVVTQRAILARYGGEVHGNAHGGMFIVLRALLGTREYGWADRVNYFRGIFASMDLLWPQLMTIDLFAQVPELRVPVYFLLGRHDHEAPSVLAERYYQALRAPAKQLIWFERSAHFLNIEEADAFNRFFTEKLRAETGQPGPGGPGGRGARA
jgi:pimeloyl-ACP methyl ester carboxylesterase